MTKKLVWVWIVLFLGLIIFPNTVFAVQYGFRHSIDYCGSSVDGTYSGAPDQLRTEFFERFTDAGFSVFTQPEIIRDGGKSCMDDVVQTDDKLGVFAYSYLYTLDSLTTTTFRVGSHTSQNENWHSTAQFQFYNMDGYSSGSLEAYLKSITPQFSCGNVGITDDSRSGTDGSIWSYATGSCPLGLSEGYYFILAGVVGEEGGRIGGGASVTLGSSLAIARFNSEESSAYTQNLNRLSATSGNPRYIITDKPLTQTELNAVFGNRVENTSWLCNLAGGKKLTDAGLDITDSAEDMNSLKNNNFVMSHLCCGNTPGEVYSFDYGSKTYLCKDSDWISSDNYGECSRLVTENTNMEQGNVYEDVLNVKNLDFYDIKTGSLNGSDGCCGDDFPIVTGYGDYGYISRVNNNIQYFCYDENKNPNDPKFTWLNAMSPINTYKIKTLYKETSSNSGQVDLISNSQEWYYCDANGKNLLNDGIPIPENGTFANAYVGDNVPCTVIADVLYSKEGESYVTCTGEPSTWKSCCEAGPPVSIYSPRECDDVCYTSQNKVVSSYTPQEMCDGFKLDCLPNAGGAVSEDDSYVDKASCPSDPDALSCVDIFSPDVNSDCESQSNLPQGYTTFSCEKTQMCGNGTSINTNDITENCCYGINPYCRDIPVISTQNECRLASGEVYSPSQYTCDSNSPIGSSGLSCCFSIKIPTPNFLSFIKTTTVLNSSFICFKQNGQDVISDCCYDENCQNADLMYGQKLSNAYNRVQSLGGVFHTLQNFDVVSGSMIVDKMKIYSITSTDSSNSREINFGYQNYNLNLSQFTYLEFDVEFSTPLTVSINNLKFGNLSQYLTNGDKIKRRHHAVIPIPKDKDANGKSLIGEHISTLKFTIDSDSKPAKFLIDNIILTPDGADLQYNTPNYYCTGGFEGWIQDLDPPTSWTSTELADWTKYGKYAMTCDSQSAFGWTGTMCCGDDTKRNYGEFYNDTIYACFNGTVIKNGWSIGYAKNYYESNQLSRDQLDDYPYSGILYFNNTFVGCQIPNHDVKLNISKYGFPSGIKLVKKFNDTQCSVIGEYYCMNGVWRSEVLTNDAHLGVSTVQLKTAPSGVELIKNGFRGNVQ